MVENQECRTSLGKVRVVLPKFVALNLLLNLSIMVKELSRILSSFQTVTPSAQEAVELRTVSASVEHAEETEDDQPFNDLDDQGS